MRWLWPTTWCTTAWSGFNLPPPFARVLMYPVSGMWLFWIPMIHRLPPRRWWPPYLLSLGFQFFVHTQVVGKLANLNGSSTPSHHRCTTPATPDTSIAISAGVSYHLGPAVWHLRGRRLGELCRFGITKPIHSFNPSPHLPRGRDAARGPGLPWRQSSLRCCQTGGPTSG